MVAFAAEAGENIDRAREKLTRKNADLIVLNDISNPAIGFESQENAITLIDSASKTPSHKLKGHHRGRHPRRESTS